MTPETEFKSMFYGPRDRSEDLLRIEDPQVTDADAPHIAAVRADMEALGVNITMRNLRNAVQSMVARDEFRKGPYAAAGCLMDGLQLNTDAEQKAALSDALDIVRQIKGMLA